MYRNESAHKIFAYIMTFIIVFMNVFNVSTDYAYANTNDYRDISYEPLIKPTASFRARNATAGEGWVNVYEGENLSTPPRSIGALNGDVIEFRDESEDNNGRRLVRHDFQINPKGGRGNSYSSVASSYTVNQDWGIIDVFLNVEGEATREETRGWRNWSQNGSHRSLGTNASGDYGYWYYVLNRRIKSRETYP